MTIANNNIFNTRLKGAALNPVKSTERKLLNIVRDLISNGLPGREILQVRKISVSLI